MDPEGPERTIRDNTTAKADELRVISHSESALVQLIREGTWKMLQAALYNEVAEFLERTKDRRKEEGLREFVTVISAN